MFVNLTPHPITLQSADGTRLTIPPSGAVARIEARTGQYIHTLVEHTPGWAGIAIHARTEYGEPVGLPAYDPYDSHTYIVSVLFAGRVDHRADVVCPGTGPADGCIRDDKGQVVAVTRLIRA